MKIHNGPKRGPQGHNTPTQHQLRCNMIFNSLIKRNILGDLTWGAQGTNALTTQPPSKHQLLATPTRDWVGVHW